MTPKRATPAPAALPESVPVASDWVGGPDDEQDRLRALQRALGVRFHDPDTLRLALTHRSIMQDVVSAGGDVADAPRLTNERLEFLGDAILGAVAAEFVYDREQDADEGTLTRHRVALVRAETLVRWARELRLGECLYLGHGERPTDSARDRMLAGAFEAVIGAIFVDRGLAPAKKFLMSLLDRDAHDIIARAELGANPKGRLQELLQELHRQGPNYRTIATDGPAHAQVFTVEVLLGDRVLGSGSGPSKREAQQAAAAAALTSGAVEATARSAGSR